MTSLMVKTQTTRLFRRARGKALIHRALAHLQGQPNDLLAYDEVRQKARAGLPIYRGLREVPVRKIVGSVNRYQEFDRAFLPTQTFTEHRWKRVGEGYLTDVYLPPVQLYQVGDVYFVVDGNHRVSVARELGREYIDAEVMECRTRVPITEDVEITDLEVIGERVAFLEATRLDELRPDVVFEPTIPGGYHLLLEHIEVHRYLQSQEWEREFDFTEAAVQWCDQVYRPIVDVIRRSQVLTEFPANTETDLYIWIIEHQYFLRQRYGDVSVTDAARSFTDHFAPNPFKRFWHWLTHHVLGQGDPIPSAERSP